MKSASTQMIALLNSGGPFCMADLYTFTTAYGDTVYATDADLDIIMGGNTYVSKSLILERTKTKLVLGLETDSMTVKLSASPSVLVGGASPFTGQGVMQAIRGGYLDGARLRVDKFISSSFTDSSNGVVNMFSGRVANIDISRAVATIEVRSDLELLDMQLPRQVYQYGCVHTLYDSGCTLNPASFAFNGTVASGSTQNQINVTGITQADHYFALGKIKFTSGANNGIAMGVRDYLSNSATLSYALPYNPAIGDAFTLYAGCDKQMTTCTNKFSNIIHFKGMPFVPSPETSI